MPQGWIVKDSQGAQLAKADKAALPIRPSLPALHSEDTGTWHQDMLELP